MMGDELNRTCTWICPNCGEKYEEPDIGQLEVRTQTHKCKNKLKSKLNWNKNNCKIKEVE